MKEYVLQGMAQFPQQRAYQSHHCPTYSIIPFSTTKTHCLFPMGIFQQPDNISPLTLNLLLSCLFCFLESRTFTNTPFLIQSPFNSNDLMSFPKEVQRQRECGSGTHQGVSRKTNSHQGTGANKASEELSVSQCVKSP